MPRIGLGTSLVVQPRRAASGGGGPPASAITFDDVGFVASQTTNWTIPLTVAAAVGKQRLVAIASIVIAALPSFAFSVTVDGEAATPLGLGGSQSDGGGPNAFAHTRFYLAPGTGNTEIDVVVNSDNGEQAYVAYAACWTLENVGSLLDHAQQNRTDGGVLDLSVDTGENGVAAAVAFGYSGGSSTLAWAGLTENFDSIRAFDDNFSGAAVKVVSPAEPHTVTSTWSSLSSPVAQAGAAVSFSGAS